MTGTNTYSDSPITEPTDDHYGLDPFAQALAQSLRNLDASEGSVISVNGPWGSGKSSAVNLILHHLKADIEAKSISVIRFNCWWFRGDEALALAFFRELYAGMKPSLGETLKKTLPKLGARLLKTGSALSPLMGAAGIPDKPVAGAVDWLGSLIEDEDSVEALHKQLAHDLRAKGQRFVVVIDDMDRLSPDEALLIFRLVKSAGRLPNVLYLLAYDRDLAEKIVAERYPSEGPHYLEKIVQATFEIPNPAPPDLHTRALWHIETICGAPDGRDMTEIMNIFYDVVAPELTTPRDVVRLANTISVTWPAIEGQVYVGDFVALETWRLFQPKLYRNVRGNKSLLCKVNDWRYQTKDRVEERFDAALLSGVPELERPHKRTALQRLFPTLRRVWSNTIVGDFELWAQQRRVCSAAHFDTYFRFALSDEALPREELDTLIETAGEEQIIEDMLRANLHTLRRSGATRIPSLLSELTLHADRVRDDQVTPLLRVVFRMADELDVERDEDMKMLPGLGNRMRVHWLVRGLTTKRYSLENRSSVLSSACESAALCWLVDFATSALGQHHRNDDEDEKPPEERLTTTKDAEALRARALAALRGAAASGELASHRHLGELLYRWRDLCEKEDEVRTWTTEQLRNDAMVARFAESFTSQGWSQGVGFSDMGDRVATRHVRVDTSGIQSLLDVAYFEQRLQAVAQRDDADGHTAAGFLEAWGRAEG